MYRNAKGRGKGSVLSVKVRKGQDHWKAIGKKSEKSILKLAILHTAYSSRTIGLRLGFSSHGVWNVLKRNGLNTRKVREQYVAFNGKSFVKQVSLADKGAMIHRHERGERPVDLCRTYGISRTVFYRWLKRYRSENNNLSALHSLRPTGEKHWRYVAGAEDQVLDLVILHPEYTSKKLAEVFLQDKGTKIIGAHGIYNILKRHNLNTYEKRLQYATSTEAVSKQFSPVPDFKLPEISRYSFISFLSPPLRRFSSSYGIVIGFFLIVCLFLVLLVTSLIQADTLVHRIGIFFAFISLLFGLFFFLYSLKYYISVAVVLSFSRRGGEEERGLGGFFSRIFGISISIETQGEVSQGGARNSSKLSNLAGRGVGLQADLSDVVLTSSPFVSVHVSTYNEKRVIDRLLTACTSLDYPNYEVVVADDSTDETVELLSKWAHHPRVKISHRTTRTGYKGAALQQALSVTDQRAAFILVFDADFIPYPDSIVQFLKYFQKACGTLEFNSELNSGSGISSNEQKQAGSNIAAVQGYQWHVLNKSENWITRGVRSEYAGSYVIERSGAELYGGLKQISGSVYMIRRDVLQGIGWGTSLTEDFELTLKLYERGYKVVYTPYIQAPAEAVSTIKRLIRQRMRWAEGHSFNIKRMFGKLLFSPRLTLSEKLEFLYLSPYYLQAAFFIIGTLCWFASEVIFQTRLPFWTEVWGWSLVATNLFALPLMNMVGLFMEETQEKDYLGLFSFIVLSYVVAPFQAYAAVKGFIEKTEGPWFRTPKTGRITDTLMPGRIARFVRRIFGAPSIVSDRRLAALPVPTFLPQPFDVQASGRPAFVPSFVPVPAFASRYEFTPKRHRNAFTRLIVLLIMFSVLTANFLPLFSLTPDNLPVFRTSAKELGLAAAKSEFSPADHPQFSLKLDPSLLPSGKTGKTQKTQTGGNFLSHLFGPGIASASEQAVTARLWYKKSTVPDIHPTIKDQGRGSYSITVTPGRFFTPGNYTLETRTTRNGKTYTAYQDFSWGVLAINTRKSIYVPGETIDFGFGAVDEEGKTICDASLTLTIAIPSEKKPIVLTSDKGTITRSGKCGASTVTNTPDYQATIKAHEKEETYHLRLEALTANGRHAIDDTLKIQKDVPFTIERSSYPTRIFPPAGYPVILTVKANQDFAGTVTDTLPYSFEVKNISDGGKSDHSSFVMPYSKTGLQTVSWQTILKKGETYTFSYTIKFPPQSPEFYLAGPLEFKQNNNSVFQEARQWQIAADANVQIRQEINILDSTDSGTGTVNSSEIVQLDTTQYSGTVNYYFEAVVNSAASNTGTIALRRSGTTTNDTSINVGTNTTYNRIRSSSFSPPAGQTEYVSTLVGDGTRTQNVKAARIIITQNAASITGTETQIEIGNNETGKNNTSDSALNSPKYWKYDSSLWDATPTAYAEVTFAKTDLTPVLPTVVNVGTVANGTGAVTPGLPTGHAANDINVMFCETNNQTISVANWTQAPSSPQSNGTSRLTVFYRREVTGDGNPATNDSGDHQVCRIIGIRGVVTDSTLWNATNGTTGGSNTTGSIPGNTTTVANTMVLVAASTDLDNANTSAFSGWTNGNLANLTERMDNDVISGGGGGFGVASGQKVTAGDYGATTVNYTTASTKGLWSGALKGLNDTSPLITIKLQEDNGSFGSWTDKVTIVNAATNTSATRTRVAFTPTTGKNYRIVSSISSTNSTYDIYNAKVIVDQGGSMSLDAVYSGRNSTGDLTYNHTVGANANLLVVGTSVQDSNHANYPIIVKYNETNLTQIRSDEGAGNVRTELWYMVNPTTGNNVVNVSTTIGPVGELAVGSISFINAKTTGVPDANNGSTGNSTNPSTTVTTVANNSWTVSVVGAEDAITAAGTQTLRWGPLTDQSFENSEGATETVTSAGATTLNYTLNSAKAWAISAASFAPGTATNITKLEAQYLLLNTKSTATGLQTYNTLWDSSEWASVNNTYIHAIDVNQTGGTTTVVLQDIDNSNSNLTSSNISTSITTSQQVLSSAITMPTTGHQVDTNITAFGTTGEVDGSRILVQVDASASGAVPESPILLLLLSPLLWFGILKLRRDRRLKPGFLIARNQSLGPPG
jgi:cellulose synthase/poly-beta-1,6-N-acetylglucosamine synthase-like glycosyltransferase